MMPDDIDVDVEPPAIEAVTHEAEDPQDGTQIDYVFEADVETGKIEWTAEWDGGDQSGSAREISDKHGAVLFPRSPKINGEKTAGAKLPNDKLDQLREDLQAAEDYRSERREAEREAALATPLELTVTEHEWQMGHRTKYDRSAGVLQPNKSESYWTDEEAETMEALFRELGEADDMLRAEPADEDGSNPFEDVAEGTTLSVEEAASYVDGVESVVAEIQAEQEAAERLEELREEHPELRGVGVDPDDVEDAFAEAAETGEDVVVVHGAADCDGSVAECSLDRLAYYATPGGEIEVERTHTH